MADPFLGQLSLVAFNFGPAPAYQLANGQILSISQNTALFSLFGTNFGGNGISTFALPNMQGNVALGAGTSPSGNPYVIGEVGGEQSVTLSVSTVPGHSHTPMGRSSPATSASPVGNALAETPGNNIYSNSMSPLTPMSPSDITFQGGSGPHKNLMPFVGMYWVVALQGIFPTRG